MFLVFERLQNISTIGKNLLCWNYGSVTEHADFEKVSLQEVVH
jgi:hypothetical protein